MRYIAWIEVQRFYSSHFERRQPDARDYLISREKRVLDCSVSAAQRGVKPDMGLSEAKSLCHGIPVISWKEEDFESEKRKWLDIVSAYSSVIEPFDQHIAAIDLSSHPKPNEVRCELEDALGDGGFNVEMGIARNKWMAKAALDMYAGSDEPYLDPLGFIGNVPVEYLPIPLQHAQRLRFLGYYTIGQLSSLSMNVLSAQFGEFALPIYRAARGQWFEKVLPLYPHDYFTVSRNLELPISSKQEWEEVSNQLASRLRSKMRAGLAGRTLSVNLVDESGRVFQNKRTFIKPLASIYEIARAVILLGRDRPNIVSVAITISDLQHANRGQLKFLTAKPVSDMAHAVASVTQVFGETSLMLACKKVEPRRLAVLRAWKNVTGWS